MYIYIYIYIYVCVCVCENLFLFRLLRYFSIEKINCINLRISKIFLTLQATFYDFEDIFIKLFKTDFFFFLKNVRFSYIFPHTVI